MSRRLRIVHCFRAPVGGVFRHVRDLAEAQTAMGHDVGLVCDATTGGAREDALLAAIGDRLDLGVTRVPMQRTVGLGDVTAGWRTFHVIKGLRPDVVHGHGAKGGAYARLFGTLMRPSARRFYSPHGGSLHFEAASATGRLVFTAERAMARVCDGLFFVCEFERQTYMRKVGPPRTASHVVHNGLRRAEFEPVALADDPADVLFIGEIRTIKGPDILIEAIPPVEQALGRPIRVVIVGEGRELENCRALAARLGLAGRVEFRPAMPAREAFALARVVVVPSRAEAFPYIVLEALAARRPVIAGAVGGIPEIFGPRSAALVAPEVQPLAARLAAALADPEAFAAAMPGAAELRRRFAADVMAQAITAAYDAP